MTDVPPDTTTPQPIVEESKPIDPELSCEQKFIMLGESAVNIQSLKNTYKTSKANSVRLRKELMATVKLCEDLRKCVLETKKAIPTKPRVKKAVKIVEQPAVVPDPQSVEISV